MNDNDSSSWSSDRCCPYQPALLSVVSILTLVAMILTYVAAFDCHFYEVKFPFWCFIPSEEYSVGFGLWTRQQAAFTDYNYFDGERSVGDCKGWNYEPALKELLDAPMKFARAMSLIAIMLSPFICLSILALSRITMPRMFIKALAISISVLSFIILLCLVAVASDNCTGDDDYENYIFYGDHSCKIDSAGISCIFASILWFGAGRTTLELQTRPETPPQRPSSGNRR